MNRSIVGRLIAKDLYLYRWLIAGALLAAVASLVLSGFDEGDNVRTGLNLGFLLFITTIIAFGIAIAMLVILKERQDRSQLFVLSLPVSTAQYAIAKVLAALAAYLVPWLALTAGVVVLTVASGRPHGGIPFFVLMMTLFLGNFCLLMAVIVITMSERWAVAGILLTNVAVTVFLVEIGNLPGVAGRAEDAVATWSPTVLTVLAVEVVWILLSLGLAFALPSRKKDFV
jgi:ABC-2 type transport system permease protein